MTENLQHYPANQNFAGEVPLADLLPHVFSLDGLRDRKGRRRINLVQDERLRERLFEHWKQQKEMPFGCLLYTSDAADE